MKIILIGLVLAIPLWHGETAAPRLYRRFTIGPYQYRMWLSEQYNHDDDAYVTYFEVTSSHTRTPMCSATQRTLHLGTVVEEGTYHLTQGKLRFTTRTLSARKPFRNKQTDQLYVPTDSTATIFLPDAHGKLQLAQYLEFRSGQVITHNY